MTFITQRKGVFFWTDEWRSPRTRRSLNGCSGKRSSRRTRMSSLRYTWTPATGTAANFSQSARVVWAAREASDTVRCSAYVWRRRRRCCGRTKLLPDGGAGRLRHKGRSPGRLETVTMEALASMGRMTTHGSSMTTRFQFYFSEQGLRPSRSSWSI